MAHRPANCTVGTPSVHGGAVQHQSEKGKRVMHSGREQTATALSQITSSEAVQHSIMGPACHVAISPQDATCTRDRAQNAFFDILVGTAQSQSNALPTKKFHHIRSSIGRPGKGRSGFKAYSVLPTDTSNYAKTNAITTVAELFLRRTLSVAA